MNSLYNILNSIRRKIHQFPELSFNEFNTTETIKNTLESNNLSFKSFNNLNTGGYCDVGNGKTIIGFRADIDALPINESLKNAYHSKIPGHMHACGHDFHTALGIGLALYFKKYELLNNIKLRLLFQPAEEAAPGGAEFVIKEECFKPVKYIFAIHITPQIVPGNLILLNGPVQASSTSIKISLEGPGGHTSKPNETKDLILITSNYISQLYALCNSLNDENGPLIFALGSINGGSKHNIIPQKIHLSGTFRTLNNLFLESIPKMIQEFSSTFAKKNRIKISVDFPTNCPATINDSILYSKFLQFVESENLDKNIIINAMPSMGADDFAFYTKIIPGLYIIAGGGGSGTLHSGDLVLDEFFIEKTLNIMTTFFSWLDFNLSDI